MREQCLAHEDGPVEAERESNCVRWSRWHCDRGTALVGELHLSEVDVFAMFGDEHLPKGSPESGHHLTK